MTSIKEICNIIDGPLSQDPSGWYGRAKIRHGCAHNFLHSYIKSIDKRWYSFDGRSEMDEGERCAIKAYCSKLLLEYPSKTIQDELDRLIEEERDKFLNGVN